MSETIEAQVNEAVKDLPDYNYLLGKGITQPFNAANSGSRKLMYAIHRDQFLIPEHGEIPIIQTGFENEVGRNSSSYVESDFNYKVLYKIPKYSFRPEIYYYLIVQNLDTGEYDLIERVFAKHNTESYGYLFENSYLDSLNVGDEIRTGTVMKKSNGFDDYNNRLDGVNLTTMYMSSDQNMEDSIIISETASKKLSTILIKNPSITINDNDILINRYGDESRYKAFPDIGEDIQGSIFCSIRRLENSNVLYTLSQSNLRQSMMSDKNIIINGTVIDIDVYCNNVELLSGSEYNKQLYFYYNQSLEFCRTLYNAVAPLEMNGTLSYNLNKLYSKCRETIGGRQFFKDRPFNNVVMDIKIAYRMVASKGDKMTDRYGGKGVISEIRPDSMMPKLDNGRTVEVIKNQSTCINRENLGQIHEQSLTFMQSRILDYCRMGVLSNTEQAELIYKFIYMVEPDLADFYKGTCNFEDDYEARIWVDMFKDDDCIILSIPPFTTNITLDRLAEMYEEFDWITPYKVKVPIEDSNGNIRYSYTKRPLIIGKIYNYRLKQYAEEKFSVTSLAATNVKNLNTKSKANKVHESKFSRTPIMFGAMESGNMAHLGMQYVVMNLMLYSSSPQGRRLFEKLLTGDPYNIDIKLDRDSKNRNAEIINTIFKTMGLKLTFKKVPKKIKRLVSNIMCTTVRNKDFDGYRTNIRDIIGHNDELDLRYKSAISEKDGTRMTSNVMCKIVDKDKK
jgi:DNA-directed RNA polymerase beta subunit